MTKKSDKKEMPIPSSISKLSFEDAMEELEKLVHKLEDGQAKLEDAIGAYERGSLLKRHCANKLREAEMRIEKITMLDDKTS